MKNKKFSYDGRSRPTNDLYKENFNRIFNPTLTKNMPNVNGINFHQGKGQTQMEYKPVINKWALVKKFPRRLYSKIISELNHYQGLILLLILLSLLLG